MPRHGRLTTVALTLSLLAAPAAYATDESESADLVEQHLAAREDVLTRQHESARVTAKRHAWLAYRLARRRNLGFFANVDGRRDDARAADHAVGVLRRSVDEQHKIAHELQLVRGERAGLGVADGAGRPEESGAETPTRFVWPLLGTVVVPQGVRTDSMTGIRVRETGVQVLSRMDVDVKAPADGHVHRVETLSEGGHAVVLAHAGGYTTIISGLREVHVAVGNQIVAGRTLGLVGRTLDTAPVVRIGIWKGAEALDPQAVFKR